MSLATKITHTPLTTRHTKPRKAQTLDIKNYTAQADWFALLLKYVDDVLTGSKLANRYEIAACQRFADDYEKQDSDDYPYAFSHAKAYRAINFIQRLPHVKGDLSRKPGREGLLQLSGFELFIVGNIFGWIHKTSGLRRFTHAYMRIPRKNNKSTLSSGIGLYCLCADGEGGAEVLCGATTLEQARKVYDPAYYMAKRVPAMAAHYKIDIKRNSLTLPDGSHMAPLIGDPGDGGNPSCAIVDEYHEHDDDTLYQTMLTGMGTRSQPLMLIITTSGKNLFSPCFEMDRMMRDLLDGLLPGMDHMFTVLYGIDDDDDWRDPRMLIKANPNYGRSVRADYLEKQLAVALQKPGYQADFKTKHLNLWCNEKNAYYKVDLWNRLADTSLRLEDFEGEKCWIGADFARKRDLSAKIYVFPRLIDGKTHYYVFSKFYICYSQLIDNDSKVLESQFNAWNAAGFLEVCDGNEHDFARMADDVLEDAHRFDLQEFDYDPFGAGQIHQTIAATGTVTVEIPAHGAHWTVPINELESAIDTGRIHHDGNPVMSWCIGNVVVFEYKGGKKMADKPNQDSKIDGAAALFNALNRCVVPEETTNIDFYLNNPIGA